MLRHFKVLGKDLLTYGFMGVLSRSVGLLLLPVFTRVFSIDEYGTIDIIATFTGLVSTGFLLSLPSSIARYYHDKRVETDSQYTTLLLFVFLICLAGFFVISLSSDRIALLISDKSDVSPYIILGAAAGCVGALNRFPDSLLRMQKRIVSFNLINITATVTYALGAIFAAVVLKTGLMGIFVAQLIGYLLHLLLGLYLTRSFLTFRFSSFFLRLALKFSLPMFPAVFVTWANQQVSRIILLTMLGLAGVGLFGAASRIASIALLFVTIFQQSWAPFSMEMIGHKDRSAVYQRSLQYYTGGFAIICILLVALSPNIVSVLIPQEYHSAYIIIPWIIGAAVLHGAANIANMGASVNEKTVINSIAAWTGFALNILISIPLIHFFGILGAAIGTFAADFVFVAMLWRNTTKLTDIRFEYSRIMKVVAIYCLLSICVVAAERALLSQPIGSLLVRLLAAAVAIYFVIRLTVDTMLMDGLRRAARIIMGRVGLRTAEVTRGS